MKYNLLILISAITIFNSCMVGPDFQKTEIDSPEKYQFAVDPTDTVLNLKWWELFNDTTLVTLIDSALLNNNDVRIAASKIEEARIYLGYTKADMYPNLSYKGSGVYGNRFRTLNNGKTSASMSTNINLSWEIDFWGKYRRANEAARAELLGSQYGLQSIQISIINEVSNAYYTLLDFKRRAYVAKRTLESRVESTRIIKERFDKGIIPEIDLNQAQIQEAIAEASIPSYERSIAYAENALSVLTGENPHRIDVKITIKDLTPPHIPVGLPSQLLTRRPDILAMEQKVKAQNANIGVAQAMRFPSISLTAMAGLTSFDLATFNASDALIGSAGAGLFGPIFNFGKNKRRVEIEKEKTKQIKLEYEKTVLNAFKETEDALVNISTLNREFNIIEKQLSAAKNAAKLSRMRYDGGITSYLEVLESERTLFNIELYHSKLTKNRLKAYTNLYKVLGGGWINKN
jgi:multidrug efflux system outer membrane protein